MRNPAVLLAVLLLGLFAVTGCSGGGSDGQRGNTPVPQPGGKDYILPYSVSRPSSDGNDVVSSYVGVDADNFANVKTLVSGNLGDVLIGPQILFAGDLEGDKVTHMRPHSFVFVQNQHLMRMGLRKSDDPAPVQVSNASLSTLCFFGYIYDDPADPLSAFMVYLTTKTAGDDCFLSQLQAFRVRLSDGADVAPVALPDDLGLMAAFYDANARLQGILVATNQNLQLLDRNFSNPTTLMTGLTEAETLASTSSGALLRIGNSLRAVSSSGAVSDALYTLRDGETIVGYANDDDDLFLATVFTTTESSDPPLPILPPPPPTTTVHAQLLRVRLDGSQPAETLYSVSDGSVFSNLFVTQDKLIFARTASGSEQPPLELDSLDKNVMVSDSQPATPEVWETGTNTQFFDRVAVSADQVFYNLVDASQSTSAARIRDETGALVKDFGTGSSFAGTQIPNSIDAVKFATFGESAAPTQVFVVTGISDQQNTHFKGGSLMSYRVADGAMQTLLPTITEDATLYLDGAGTVGLGTIEVQTNDSRGTQNDVFAYDLDSSAFIRITDTPDQNESPLP